MATKDGFPPYHSPLFLSEPGEKGEQPDIGKALNRAAISSRILKTSILAVTATAIGIAVLSVGNPVELVGNVTALWGDKSALQAGADPSASTTQSIASAQDLPSTRDAPTRDEIATPIQPADQNQTEISQPPTEALFKQFQAWAAEEDTRAQVEPKPPVQQEAPVQPLQTAPVQVVQDVPAQQVVQDAPAPVHSRKKHRRLRSVQNARAEIRPQRNHRARVREEQAARVQVPPVPDVRAPEQPAQNAQTPWLLQSFGWRN